MKYRFLYFIEKQDQCHFLIQDIIQDVLKMDKILKNSATSLFILEANTFIER